MHHNPAQARLRDRPMNVRTASQGGRTVIAPSGCFGFAGHRAFRGAAKTALADRLTREIVVDLAAVDYIDSSALGMLLLTCEDAAAANKTVSLAGARGKVDQILRVTRFECLFAEKSRSRRT